MSRLGDLVRQDWDDIGQNLLLAAAEAMAEAARKRANAHAGAIRIERQSESKVTISISERMLVTRERGDATIAPSPFLSPSAEDRLAIHHIVTERLREEIP